MIAKKKNILQTFVIIFRKKVKERNIVFTFCMVILLLRMNKIWIILSSIKPFLVRFQSKV